MAAIVSVPTIVMGSVVLVVGVAGNAVVCYVCGRRLAGRSVLNNFVLALAVLDLVGCGLCLPLELVQLSINSRSSPSTTAALCLSHRFLRYLLLVSSFFLLLAIATERYRRICRPQTRPLDLPRCRLVIVASVIVAVFLSWPSLFIFGHDDDYYYHHHHHHHHNTAGGSGRSRGPEGRDGRSAELTVAPEAAVDREPVSLGVCHIKPSMRRSVYPVIYFSGLFVIFFLACLLLATLYTRIAFAIWRPRKLHTDARARSASLPDCRRLNAAPSFAAALLGRDVIKALPSPAGAGGAAAAALESAAPSCSPTSVVGSSSTLGRSVRLLGRNVLNFGHKPSSFHRQDIGNGVVQGDDSSPVRRVGEKDATAFRRVEASPEDSSSETRESPTELTAMLEEDAAGDVAIPTVADDKHEVTEAEALDRVTTDESPPHVVQGVMTVGRCGLLFKKDFYKLGTWRRPRVQRDLPFRFPAAPTVHGPDATASAAVPGAMYDELTRSLHFRRKREAVSKLLLLSPTSSYRRQRRAAYSRTRTTLIMFIMTLVSIISYLPYVIISAVFASASDLYFRGPASLELGSPAVVAASSSLLGHGHAASSAFPATAAALHDADPRPGQREVEGENGGVGRLTVASAMVLTLCLKSYLISGALNPVIYGFCNRRFKAECRRIWRSLVARWHCWLPGHCWGGDGGGQRESRLAGKSEEAARTAVGRSGTPAAAAVAVAAANAVAAAVVTRTSSKDRLEESSETSPSDL